MDSKATTFRQGVKTVTVIQQQIAARDAEWIRSIGEFRKALHNAGLHGHYTLLQEWQWPDAPIVVDEDRIIGEALRIAGYDCAGKHAEDFWAYIHNARAL
jgi:hypothetical protein